jgi:hypothetical protein
VTSISPKVWVPTVAAILAGVLLWLITGDKTALIVSLTGLAGGGIGAAAPPAPRVSQAEVASLARRKR